MTTPRERNTNVQLLACLIDEDDEDDSDYRFLVDGRHAKYVTTAPGAFRGAEDDRTFEPILLGELFPPFPTGDWNRGRVARDPGTGKAAFVSTETIEDGKPVLVKLAVWPWEIPFIEAETAAYRWISDSGIGPGFLGHLTEGKDGRVVGFVAEWVEGTREAGPADIEGCRKALGRLHHLGIKHGDINRHNFLVRDGHDVVLVDFEAAKRDCPAPELEAEMNALESSLGATDFRGGVAPPYE